MEQEGVPVVKQGAGVGSGSSAAAAGRAAGGVTVHDVDLPMGLKRLF